MRLLQWRFLFIGLALTLLIELPAPVHAQYEALVEKIRPAVILIETQRGGIRGSARGTGFFIDATGYVVTARHLIEGAQRIVIQAPGNRQLPAIITAYGANFDAAILKVEGADFPVISLGDSEAARQGQEVLVFGFPLPGVVGVDTVTVTRGIISAIRPSEGRIQLDAALHPGNSGSPVVNLGGEVVGIVESGFVGAQPLNFAVAANLVKTLTVQLSSTAIPAPRADPATYPLSGEWSGTYRSTSFLLGGLGGQILGRLRQDAENVDGRFQMTNSIFPRGVEVRGRFDGENLQLDAFDGGRRAVTLTGKWVTAGVIEGRYNVPFYDSGNWVVRKTGP